MQVAGNARSLRQALRVAQAHPGGHLPESKPVQRPDQSGASQRLKQLERRRLVKGWSAAESPGVPCFVPDTVVIACDDSKSILLRAKMVVESLPAGTRIMPTGLGPFQL